MVCLTGDAPDGERRGKAARGLDLLFAVDANIGAGFADSLASTADAVLAFLLGPEIGELEGRIPDLHAAAPDLTSRHLAIASLIVCPPM